MKISARISAIVAAAAILAAAFGFYAVAGEGNEPMTEKFVNFTMRDSLMRSYEVFRKGGEARVAFMGGSVTTREWRNAVMDFLKKKFPGTRFDFIMAGIGGTDANLGAFRLPSDVFGSGKVDLFFLEFAVNGGDVKATEGIIRQAKRLNPDIDIVIMYFACTGYMQDFNAGRVPSWIRQHDKVAEYYGIPVLFLYREVAEHIKADALTWEEFSTDSVHPTSMGCKIYSGCIIDFLKQAWSDPKLAVPAPDTRLPEKLKSSCYENGRYIDINSAKVKSGFASLDNWRPGKTCNFAPPVDVLEATEPGSELSLDFRGTAVGIYTIVGFDAGKIEYSIDGNPFRTKDQFDVYCDQFHRPCYLIFDSNLPEGRHTLVLRVSANKNPKSIGTAVRILKFMAN